VNTKLPGWFDVNVKLTCCSALPGPKRTFSV